MSAPQRDPVSEALVIVDLVGSTREIMLHGWHAVGRAIVDDLRCCVDDLKRQYEWRCHKFTGDGYLLTFFTPDDTERAVSEALRAIITLSQAIAQRTQGLPRQRQIRLRFALHYGEVDVVGEDREGPEVAYIFRMEGVDTDSFKHQADPTPAVTLPNDNYVLLSEEVIEILERNHFVYSWEPLPALRLKGFRGYHNLYLLRDVSNPDHDMSLENSGGRT